MPELWAFSPVLVVLIVALAIEFRWLGLLQRRVNDHAERIAWLEGEQGREVKRS